MEMYFVTNALFQVVETDFLALANHFEYIFSRFPPLKTLLPSRENIFLNESFIPTCGEKIYL